MALRDSAPAYGELSTLLVVADVPVLVEPLSPRMDAASSRWRVGAFCEVMRCGL